MDVSWSALAKYAPTAALIVALVYFGWWLRGGEVQALRDWIQHLTRTDR